jgi:hypothetical protein
VYAASQCFLQSSLLSCGSVNLDTTALLTITGRAPVVRGHAAYWISSGTGDLGLGVAPGSRMIAFEYARGGWAMVDTHASRADAIRIAANLRFGQTSGLRFPFRLAHLPPEWRYLQLAKYANNHSEADRFLALARQPGTFPGVPGTLELFLSLGKSSPPCDKSICHLQVISGYRVYVYDLPASAHTQRISQVIAPDANGLALRIEVFGPSTLTAAQVFARDLTLLGADQANWTTTPISP